MSDKTPPTALPDDDRTEAPRPARRRRRALWGALALVPALLVGGAAAANAYKTVELQIDGETQSVSTWRGSVEGLLEEHEVDLGPHDVVAPGEDATLSDGDAVVIRRASQVTVAVDGEQQPIWTTATTQAEIVSSIFEPGREITLSASRAFDRSALELPLVVDGEVIVEADGERNRVELEGEATVDDALAAAGVELDRRDRVQVGSDPEEAIVTVAVTRVEEEESTETREVEFETVRREDDSMYEGESRVVQEGSAGERTLTYRTTLVGGERVNRALVKDEVTTEPEDRVVVYGTAPRPAPEPDPEPVPATSGSGESSGGSGESSGGSGGDSGGGGGSDVPSDVWGALAQCESGGNPRAVSPNGMYYGLYQFSVSTWQSVGGSGLPSEASPAEQTQRAQALQARSGWGQWPHCSSVLGLR